MKRTANRIITAILSLFLMTSTALATELIPVGEVIGLELRSDTVTVAAFDDLTTAARDAGLQIGDEIVAIDGRSIENTEDIRKILNESDGSVNVSVLRDGKEKTIHLEPAITTEGPRLGVYLKQGITGIGTVTWYDPDTGCFGTLGHGVNDSSGNLLKMTVGRAYPASVVSIQKGKAGQPGQLKGALTGDHLLGNLSGNTAQGVFGTAPNAWEGEALPAAAYGDITTGKATIRSTIHDGEPRDYSVEILKIYPKSRSDGRNFLLKVTDPELLAATGGIVQGMGVSYNRDNTGTLKSLQGLGDSPGFSLTKRNPCTCAGTQGRTSFVSSDQAMRMKYLERWFFTSAHYLSNLISSCHTGSGTEQYLSHCSVPFCLNAITDWRKL